MSIRRQIGILALCGIAVTVLADPIPVRLEHNNIRLTYETMTLPGNEAMGLVGLNYQTRFGSYWYGGLGVYGAAAGERGGFFTGGFEGGVRYPLFSNLEAEGGVFLGGGGGGAAPQGGGLMVRPHVGVTYGNETLRGGIQLSRIEFPNGNIKSNQIGAVIDVPFESFRLDGGYRGRLDYLPYDISQTFQRSIRLSVGMFGAEVQRYTPLNGSRRTDGSALNEPFTTVGVRYENYWSHNSSWHLSTAGAMGGGADGYAEMFAGLGWRYGIFDSATTKSRLFLRADGAIGMGGGGKIDTGGGTMGKAALGLSYVLDNDWLVDIRSGYLRSVDGNFEARTLAFELNHAFTMLEPSRGTSQITYDEGLIRSDWEVRPLHETYTKAKRKDGGNSAVSMVGMQIDVLSSGAGYLYGKALGAYSGYAGGYATGTIGAGINYRLPLEIPMSLYAQAGVGAAGGGGVDVGSGSIVEAEAGAQLNIASNLDLLAGGGIIHGMSGEMESPTFSFALAYRFGTLGNRHPLY